MLTLLSTIKARLALTVTDYDDLLTSAIKAISTRFDKETSPTSVPADDDMHSEWLRPNQQPAPCCKIYSGLVLTPS